MDAETLADVTVEAEGALAETMEEALAEGVLALAEVNALDAALDGGLSATPCAKQNATGLAAATAAAKT